MMNTSLRTCVEIANKNIASLYSDELINISELPKIIQSHIKHCVHHLANDVMSEHEPFNGKVRTYTEWANRQIAHCLGDIEEIEFDLDPEISNLIKRCMHKTAKFAHLEYEKYMELPPPEEDHEAVPQREIN